MLSNDFKPVIQEGSNLKDRQFNLEKPYIREGLSNIIEAQYSNGYKYYADLPISSIIQRGINEYKVIIKPNTGFRYVTYQNDGTKPSYKKGDPFEINIYKTIINDIEEEVTNYQNEGFTYEWEVIPRESKLLQIVSENDKNVCTAVPVNVFTKGNQVDNALLLTIKKEDEPFAQVHIPIHFMLNRYENRALNDWSGTAIEINNEDGYILTPQVGAGKKNQDNSFTGIIMGQTKTKNKDQAGFKDQTGLFGYAAGARSIFLDANTGNATFGLADKGGQIEINVANEDAIIKSSDYPIDKTTGKLAGMEIRFSGDPHIKFGSGNFEVSSEGHIHAVGGGDIAGWQIGNDSLSKGYVTLSSNNSSPTNKAIKVTDGNKDIFSVDYRGYLHSEQGDIAGWTIEPNRLYKNNVGMASTGEHAFWAGDSFYVNHDGTLHSSQGDIGGWQIKSDRLVKNNVGLSPVRTANTPNAFWAGNVFHVTHDGYLYAKNGNIGDWYFGNKGLYSNGGTPYWDINGTGVYVGADGIRLGRTFYVNSSGKLFARAGDIGSCTITNSGISGANWWIGGDGSASFSNVSIGGRSVIDLVGLYSNGGGGGGSTGTSIGSGASIGNGAVLNPGSGGVRTPDGETLDWHTKQLIVKTLRTDELWSRIGTIGKLNVGTLQAGNIFFNDDTDVGTTLQFIQKDLDDIWRELANKADKSDIPSTTP